MARSAPAAASLAFAAAINAGDAAAALDCWTREAVIVGADGSHTRGHAELRERFGQLIAAGVSLEIEVGDAVEAGDAVAARSRMTMTPPSGDPLTVRAGVVYTRRSDGWRIAIDRIDQPARATSPL